MIQKAIMVERSKAAPPSAATSSSAPAESLPPPPPKSGGAGEHAGASMCDVCGLRHLSATNGRRDQVQCWNKRNYLEYMGNPKLAATKDKFRKLAEANPGKYVPHKKPRVV